MIDAGVEALLDQLDRTLSFARDEYQIMAITRTAVVLRQKSNNKTWAVEYAEAPERQGGSGPKKAVNSE